MLSFRDFLSAFSRLGVPAGSPVIVHASLRAFGQVRGGAETVVGALLNTFAGVVAPTFTYKTMITPEVGPPDNGIVYGRGENANRMAQFYRPNMPADPTIGIIPETLRQHPKAKRSMHPILSFAGVGVDDALAAQTLAEPLAPIRVLADAGGWVLLLGVDHTVNTSLHYAEKLARRKQFIRWALTPAGIYECPGFPGCSDGFEGLVPHVHHLTREQRAGEALIQALPLVPMIEVAKTLIEDDPQALLCDLPDCERCGAVRERLN
ncbi:MAG: AAC(3) family N-acetyltransferase [Anaerolineales bacterium]